MKVGVVSDSHRKFELAKDAIDFLVENGAEYIIHAGDIVLYDTIEYIKNTNLPYVAVYGNNDAHMIQYADEFNLKKEPYYFKIKDVRFKLMHLPFYMTPDSDVIIFGHTHTFEVKKTKDTLFLNPGEVCAREKQKSEFVLLEIDKENYIVNYFYKDPSEKNYSKKVYNFSCEK